ncbi:MAG TPA: hypothetical protein VGA78_14055 [Gemmatimonadales bacterium]
MSLEGIRARIDQLLADLNRVGDARSAAAGLYDAMVETKTAIGAVRDALIATDRELVVERQRLDDAERRGRLAQEIHDNETVELARIWTAKHRERVDLLERKRLVQQDELAYAERQLAEMAEQYRKAKAGIPPGTAPRAVPPDPDPDFARLEHDADRQQRAATVEQQLAELKRKLGRQPPP